MYTNQSSRCDLQQEAPRYHQPYLLGDEIQARQNTEQHNQANMIDASFDTDYTFVNQQYARPWPQQPRGLSQHNMYHQPHRSTLHTGQQYHPEDWQFSGEHFPGPLAYQGTGQPWQQPHPVQATRGFDQSASHASEDRLVPVSDLPACLRPVFPKFRYFNPVQSESFPIVFATDTSMVVAAPTGSGKTGVMELALLRLLSKRVGPDGSLTLPKGSSKAVYLAPLRALVQEKYKDWEARFGKLLGLSCVELSGDTDPEANELDAADIICTTPEKFDAMTRKLNETGGAKFFGEIAVVLIDEVHLLNEAGRGSSLEAGVVSRIRMVSQFKEMQEMPISHVRFVAVSATIPNVADIAEWLRVPPEGLKVYGEEMRPVKLRTVVKGYMPTKNDFLFERRLNDYLYAVIQEHSTSKPTLVFCSSRRGTTETAAHLVKEAERFARNTALRSAYVRDGAHLERLRHAASTTKNKQLQTAICAGIGFHNAAMEAEDRALVEGLFLNMDILVLCTTSTLALGVNLPAHLVVIKGTRRYCGDRDNGEGRNDDSTGYKEYDRSVCLQMVGRAGRPQFDTEGVAVIMTQKETADRYRNLVSGAEEVESCLPECFAEHMLAEIVLQTIQDTNAALEWFKTTFMYIRMCKKPKQYGVPEAAAHSMHSLQHWMRETLVMDNVKTLVTHGLVSEKDGVLRALEPGRIMAHHYIRLQTMILITQLGKSAGMRNLLHVIVRAQEFSNIRLRRSEKKILNDINHRTGDNAVKYFLPDDSGQKPKQRVAKPSEKIYIMINEALCDNPSDTLDYSMRQELEQVLRVGQRIASCMARYHSWRQEFAAATHAQTLSKALRARMWEDTSQQCRQLPNVGRLLSQRLAAAHMSGLRQLLQADPRRIEAVTQRNYPFGNQLKAELKSRMPPDVNISIVPCGRGSGGKVEVEVTVTRVEDTAQAGLKSHAKLFVGSKHDDLLLLHKSLVLETFPSPYSVKVLVVPPKDRSTDMEVVATVTLDRFVGLDILETLALNPYGFNDSHRPFGHHSAPATMPFASRQPPITPPSRTISPAVPMPTTTSTCPAEPDSGAVNGSAVPPSAPGMAAISSRYQQQLALRKRQQEGVSATDDAAMEASPRELPPKQPRLSTGRTDPDKDCSTADAGTARQKILMPSYKGNTVGPADSSRPASPRASKRQQLLAKYQSMAGKRPENNAQVDEHAPAAGSSTYLNPTSATAASNTHTSFNSHQPLSPWDPVQVDDEQEDDQDDEEQESEEETPMFDFFGPAAMLNKQGRPPTRQAMQQNAALAAAHHPAQSSLHTPHHPPAASNNAAAPTSGYPTAPAHTPATTTSAINVPFPANSAVQRSRALPMQHAPSNVTNRMSDLTGITKASECSTDVTPPSHAQQVPCATTSTISLAKMKILRSNKQDVKSLNSLQLLQHKRSKLLGSDTRASAQLSPLEAASSWHDTRPDRNNESSLPIHDYRQNFSQDIAAPLGPYQQQQLRPFQTCTQHNTSVDMQRPHQHSPTMSSFRNKMQPPPPPAVPIPMQMGHSRPGTLSTAHPMWEDTGAAQSDGSPSASTKPVPSKRDWTEFVSSDQQELRPIKRPSHRPAVTQPSTANGLKAVIPCKEPSPFLPGIVSMPLWDSPHQHEEEERADVLQQPAHQDASIRASKTSDLPHPQFGHPRLVKQTEAGTMPPPPAPRVMPFTLSAPNDLPLPKPFTKASLTATTANVLEELPHPSMQPAAVQQRTMTQLPQTTAKDSSTTSKPPGPDKATISTANKYARLAHVGRGLQTRQPDQTAEGQLHSQQPSFPRYNQGRDSTANTHAKAVQPAIPQNCVSIPATVRPYTAEHGNDSMSAHNVLVSASQQGMQAPDHTAASSKECLPKRQGVPSFSSLPSGQHNATHSGHPRMMEMDDPFQWLCSQALIPPPSTQPTSTAPKMNKSNDTKREPLIGDTVGQSLHTTAAKLGAKELVMLSSGPEQSTSTNDLKHAFLQQQQQQQQRATARADMCEGCSDDSWTDGRKQLEAKATAPLMDTFALAAAVSANSYAPEQDAFDFDSVFGFL